MSLETFLNDSNSPKSILFIANGYPSSTRPWKCVFNHRAVKSLQPFYKINVLAIRAWLPWRRIRRYKYDNVLVQELLIPPFTGRLWKSCLTNRHSIKLFLLKTLVSFIEYQINRIANHQDLIHSIGIDIHSFAAQKVAEKKGIPHIVQLIGGDVNLLDRNNAMSPFFQAWVKKISGFVANSKSLAVRLKQISNLDLPITIIYRGVNSTVFHPAPTCSHLTTRLGCTFLYLGGNVRRQFDSKGDDEKGADILFRAWQQMEINSHEPSVLLVGGPHIDQRGFKNFQNTLKYPNRVICIGVLNEQEIVKILQNVDVLIVPSRNEGLPNVCLEAMACAVPVVAASVGGLREVIRPGIDGILVHPNNPTALFNALLRLSCDLPTRLAMGTAARNRTLTHFNSRDYGTKLKAVYESVLKN